MSQRDSSNTIFNLAADLVNNTSRHLFITGKAGTGKTTFLKHIVEHTVKNVVVVAPTGVAAINAGGVTMHSFFQLPFGPFVPASDPGSSGVVTDKHSLFRNIRFAASKRELLEELELLIIDEVSMVRADMLDAVDVILRHFRRKRDVPFGGVQVVYIGDMFQLPPVIPQQEWSYLKEYYAGPFFFQAKVIAEAPPLYIELKKIYRQKEQKFIDILNRIRDNRPDAIDLAVLNERFDPSFGLENANGYITLTTHNRKAEIINEAQLKKLSGPQYNFEAQVKGEFSEKALPTEMNLCLKEGAQVMFVKNDTGSGRRYFNGKLGFIKGIKKDEIIVSFTTGEADLTLERETWKNIRYEFNRENNKVEEEELGSFRQFPVRLAWAITIHKSQGLTFEKAVIDAGSSFAAGQVYVALSRCTTLEGLVLHSRIHPSAIATDPRVIEFSQNEADDEHLAEVLKLEKERFQAEALVQAFNWNKVVKVAREWLELLEGKKLPDPEGTRTLALQLVGKAQEQAIVAEKFAIQLKQILLKKDEGLLLERMNKAIAYFGPLFNKEILSPFQAHLSAIRYAAKVKKYYGEVLQIEGFFVSHLRKLNGLKYGELEFSPYQDFQRLAPEAPREKAAKVKQEKGSSHRDSLLLYREGKSIEDIALVRNLAVSTVEGHLAACVYTGDIEIEELVPAEKMNDILKVIDAVGLFATSIKQSLGDEYSFGEIRAVMNFYRLQAEQGKQPV